MKIIAFVGDSHTWGQGAGTSFDWDPVVCGGDLRKGRFGLPTYVNLVRDAVNIMTNSSAKEYYNESLIALCGKGVKQYGIVEKEVSLKGDFSLARIIFREEKEEAEVEILKDGEVFDTIVLQSDSEITSAGIKLVNLLFEGDGEHSFNIKVKRGNRALIHRIETYSGDWAVVNCAVGLCTVSRYENDFFNEHLAPLNPYAIVFEGHTINDWTTLCKEPFEGYKGDMKSLICKMRSLTDKILLHTVAPIGGDQLNRKGLDYNDYIEAVRQVAKEENLPLVDCYKVFKEEEKAVYQHRRYEFIFSDDWHPSTIGHYFYAREIFPALRDLFMK